MKDAIGHCSANGQSPEKDRVIARLRKLRTQLRDPQQNESVYGLASRYSAEIAPDGFAGWFHAVLFGYVVSEFDPRYPGGLDYFCSVMDLGWNPRSMIEDHTLWPLFRIGELSAKRRADVEANLLRSAAPGPRLRGRFQFGASRSKRFRPRYCLPCLIDDFKSGRPLTWYRHHQILGADWCPKHRVRLTSEATRWASPSRSGRSFSLPVLLSTDLSDASADEVGKHVGAPFTKPKSFSDDAALRFSAIAIGLLDKRLSAIHPSLWTEVFRSIIEDRGSKRSWGEIRKWRSTSFWRQCGMYERLRKTKWLGDSKALSEMAIKLNVKQKLCLMSAFFYTADDFVNRLKSVHEARIYIDIDAPRRST